MIEIKPIRSAEDYELALNSIAELWGAPSGTPKGDQLDVVATLVDAYEREHFPIAVPSAEAIAAFDEEEQKQARNMHVEPQLTFQIVKDSAGLFSFRLLRAYEIVLRSETFATKDDAIRAIKLLQQDAAHSEIIDIAARAREVK
jgi:uncharacterized protein YegP (UPF0339 family)